jgi:hypothetical protein
MSVLDWIFPSAEAAPAAPQVQAGQEPVDDLALRAEIARRLRESLDRNTPQPEQVVPKSGRGGFVENPQQFQDRQQRFVEALGLPQSPSASTLTPGPQAQGVTTQANPFIQTQAATSQPQSPQAAPARQAAPKPIVEAPIAPEQRTVTNSDVFQRFQNLDTTPRESFAAFLAGAGDKNQGLLARIGGGIQAQDALGQTKLAQNATFNALVKNGMPPDLAVSATLNASNPAVLEIIKQTLSPKTQVINNQLVRNSDGKVIADFRDTATKQATTAFKLPGGEEVTATFDPVAQGFVAPDGTILSGPNLGRTRSPGQSAQQQNAPAQTQQSGGAQPTVTPQQPQQLGTEAHPTASGILAPRQAQPTNPYAIGAPPPGTNAKTFRDESTKKMADEMANEREKAMGAIEFLSQSQTARDLINDKGHVIGRWSQPESETVSSSPLATILDPQEIVRHGLKFARDTSASANPEGLLASNNRARDELNQAFTKLAQSGLKATYGARVTNIDVKQQNQTVPRLTDQDAETSLNKLDTVEQQSWRTLDRSINSGLVNPTAIDPDVLVRGLEGNHLHLSPALTEAVRNYYAANRGR